MNKMIHTILFDDCILFDNQDGARFYNLTTKKGAITCFSTTVLPATLIAYHVQWTVEPQIGDRIVWQYDGHGNYRDDQGNFMMKQELIMINCADVNERRAKYYAKKQLDQEAQKEFTNHTQEGSLR